MKKFFLIIILLIGLKPESIDSQSISFGLKGETDFSNFILVDANGFQSRIKTGASLGGFLQMELQEHFALQGDFLFHYKTSELNRENQKGDYQYFGNEIAIYGIGKWRLDKGKIYVGIGPFSEFGFSSTLKRNSEKIDLYKKDEARDIPFMQDFNSGFGIMLGYEFQCGFQINAGYKISITNVLDPNSSSFSMFPNTLSFGIGYRLGK
ncbi:MAG: PorT family protein [Candidatus Azobacteroides sp.]|nr:PorT family protein [Candidatus Azobacteroides sp.]